MRIAFFTETFLPKIDGVVNTLCRLLTHLESRGHSCLLFAPQGAPDFYGQTQVIPLPGVTLPFYRELRFLTPAFPVTGTLREFQPDVIHLVNPFATGLLGLWAGRRLDVPVVSSYHTDLPGFIEKWGYRRLAKQVDLYLRVIHNATETTQCPSFATKAILEDKDFKRVGVWSRGVDRDRFNPQQFSDAMRVRLSGGEPEKPLLLYVGRLSKEKQVDHLAHLVRNMPQARLAIVGDGPHRAALEKTLVDDPVVFTGYLKGDALAQAYASSDVFVFPSENDTFGNVVLEAMASGLPVVAARSGGPMDMVHHGNNGFLFAPGHIDDLVACVSRVILDVDLHQTMRKEALREASRRSWSVVMDGLVCVYESFVSSDRYAHVTLTPLKNNPRKPVVLSK